MNVSQDIQNELLEQIMFEITDNVIDLDDDTYEHMKSSIRVAIETILN